MRKRLKKKLAQRNSAMYFGITRNGKTYPFTTFRRDTDLITKIVIRKMVKWSRMFVSRRAVQQTTVSPTIKVSTVFLGLNHGFFCTTPILFETMIFGGEHHMAMWRYTNIKKARAGHRKALALVTGSG